jgi:predicted 3-demethylubiquinone-9 3-methyltransferase (glyoxalase superfamily)
MNKIYPCLWFDGNAAEAAAFYCSVFENSSPATNTPLVVEFFLNGKKFMGLNGGPAFQKNPSISFFVHSDSEKSIKEKWDKLSEGGQVMMPLNTYPWSEQYGWCQDKFGVNWQLMLGKMPQEPIVPCLMFTQDKSGQAGEAIQFYTSLFNHSGIQLISRYEKDEPDVTGYIKHAQFTLEGQPFAAMDSPGPHTFTFNEGISLVVDCKDQDEVDYYWNNLTADGGQESRCAWLKDKYGVSWQIVPRALVELMNDKDPEKAGRVMQAMLKMKKIIVEELYKAADGKMLV